MYHPSTAFTLIELLVVIAIISLLVSILLPSLQKAKSLARSVVCMTSLRSIGTGLALYRSESDDYYPPNWGMYGSQEAKWIANMEEVGAIGEGTYNATDYDRPQGLLLCPETEPISDCKMLCSYGPTLPRCLSDPGTGPESMDVWSNKESGGMVLTYNTGYRHLPKPASLVKSDSVLVIEKKLFSPNPPLGNPPFASSYDWNIPKWTREDTVWSYLYGAAFRHLDNANFLFADYHVESLPFGTYFDDHWVP